MDQQSMQPVQPPIQYAKPETQETKTLKQKYVYFAPLTLAYAIFYAFCLYRNDGGITYPFFIAGTIAYIYLCVKKLGLEFKKVSRFSIISAVIIAFTTVLTANETFWWINKTAIFILMMCVVLEQVYNTEKWRVGKFFTALMCQCFASFTCLLRPFSDAHAYNQTKEKGKSKTVLYVIIGVLIAIPLVMVVLALLGSADAVFRETLRVIYEAINVEDAIAVAWMIFRCFLLTYMVLAYCCKRLIKEEVKDVKTFEPIIGITVTSILTFVYLVFSVVQIAYLFIGNLRLPAGYTYAEYAREGFFQLLAVSVLNYVIVLLCLAFFRDNKVLKVILTIFCACTYIMIASSAARMIMYIRYYYLTLERIIVLWALFTLTILFAGVLISIYKPDFKLFNFCKIVVTICYIGLVFSRPEYIVASVDLGKTEVSMKAGNSLPGGFFLAGNYYEDFQYISTLSADAAAPVLSYMENDGTYNYKTYPAGTCCDEIEKIGGNRYYADEPETFGYYFMQEVWDRHEDMSWRKLNYSIYVANDLFMRMQVY